ncbi:MAG: hypothetical protein K0U59_09390 [Gammaproteobacteria bacterium]|nr:hypothetical protein [Gammaproteobacteria bacterium]
MPLLQLLRILLTSSLLVVTSASAVEIPNLITSHSQEILPRQYAIASHEIHVAQAAFSGGNPTLKIELPDGKRLQWDRIAYEPRGPGEALWRGKLPNDRYSEITLTQKNKLVVGRMHFGNKTYTIRPGAAGKHILSLIDTAALPACGNGPEQRITYPKVSIQPKKLHAEKIAPTRIDLLFVGCGSFLTTNF